MAAMLEPAASAIAAVGLNAPDDTGNRLCLKPASENSTLGKEAPPAPAPRQPTEPVHIGGSDRGSGAESPGSGSGGHHAPVGFISDEEEELYRQHVRELDVDVTHPPHGRNPEVKLWVPVFHGPSKGEQGGTGDAGEVAGEECGRQPRENGHPHAAELRIDSDLHASTAYGATEPVSPSISTPAPRLGTHGLPTSLFGLTPLGEGASSPPVVLKGHAASTAEARRAQREADVRAAFVALPRIRPHWQSHYMNILLVGEDGVGRTTLTRNLFAAFAPSPDFKVADASGHDAKKVFQSDPERLCTRVQLDDAEHKVHYHYCVQDTPGYGDSLDLAADRRAVLTYIEACSCRYLEREQAPGRHEAMNHEQDPRIDVCIYLLPPHRLRQMDIAFVQELSQQVPVVPVLAKADTMTPEELKDFRHRVGHALRSAMWHWSHEALEEAGARHGPPFSVITSSNMDLATGRFWPVRRYPWGACEAMLSAHSDLTVLRRLLFEAGFNEVKECTERRYHAFRRNRAAGPVRAAASHLIRSLVTVGALVAAAWLVVNGAPVLRDEVLRRETMRRVKDKVGEAVGAAVDKVDNVSGIAKSATEAAASTTRKVVLERTSAVKETAKRAAQALETDDVRKRREEEERRLSRRGFFGLWRG